MKEYLSCRYVSLEPSSNSKIPGIYLCCVKGGSSALKVKFTVTCLDREARDKSVKFGEGSKSLKMPCKHTVKNRMLIIAKA